MGMTVLIGELHDLTSQGCGLDYQWLPFSILYSKTQIRSWHRLGHPGTLFALSFYISNIFNSIIGDIPNPLNSQLLQVFLPFPCRHGGRFCSEFTRLSVYWSAGETQTIYKHLLEIVCNLKHKCAGSVPNTCSNLINRPLSEFTDRAVMRNLTILKMWLWEMNHYWMNLHMDTTCGGKTQ